MSTFQLLLSLEHYCLFKLEAGFVSFSITKQNTRFHETNACSVLWALVFLHRQIFSVCCFSKQGGEVKHHFRLQSSAF